MDETSRVSKTNIRAIEEGDMFWLQEHIQEEWGGFPIITDEGSYHLADLEGFLTVTAEHTRPTILGEVTYRIMDDRCEIVTLSSLREGTGIGTALVNKVKEVAGAHHCTHLHLFTTTDNLNAIGFYQKRGFRITAVLPDAMDAVRAQKSQVGRIGNHGIPLQDGLIMEKRLR